MAGGADMVRAPISGEFGSERLLTLLCDLSYSDKIQNKTTAHGFAERDTRGSYRSAHLFSKLSNTLTNSKIAQTEKIAIQKLVNVHRSAGEYLCTCRR